MAVMTTHQDGTRFARLARAFGFKSKRARAAEVLAAQEQAREIERTGEREHAPSHTEDEGEHGGHHYLRP
jgi:hypothetical protein